VSSNIIYLIQLNKFVISFSNDEVVETNIPGLSMDPEFAARVNGWNYSTTPQVSVNGKVLTYARAKILGGCSSHSMSIGMLCQTNVSRPSHLDSMVYTRGSRDDYDRLASTMEDENLSWNNILPYILKVRYQPTLEHVYIA
jgi:choline dehydrogenase